MALTWDLTEVENGSEICWMDHEDNDGTKTMHPVTYSLIFSTMGVKIGKITEKNWKEFYTRLHAWEKAIGQCIIEDGEHRYITPAEVKAHIGLRCNVFDESTAVFRKSLYEAISWDAQRNLRDMETVNV